MFGITDAQSDYVREVVAKLKQAGVRAQADLRNEKVGYKVREHTMQRIPYLLVVGERERTEQTVAVRDVAGNDLGSMNLAQAIVLLSQKPDRK